MSRSAKVLLCALGAVLLAVTAVVLTGLALVGGRDVATAPILVRAGQDVRLPDATPFSGDASLYAATVPSTVRQRDLGCTFRNPQGRTIPVFVSTLVLEYDPLTVDGRSVQPLAALGRIGIGTTMTCSGSAVATGAPVYLVTGARPVSPGAWLMGGLAVLCGLGAVAATVAALVFGLRGRRP